MTTNRFVQRIDLEEIKFTSNSNVLSLRSSPSMISDVNFTYPSTQGSSGDYLITDGIGNTFWSQPTTINTLSLVSLNPLTNNSSSTTDILSSDVVYIIDTNSLFDTSNAVLLLTLLPGKGYIVEISSYFENASDVNDSTYFVQILDNSDTVVFSTGMSFHANNPPPSLSFNSRWLFQPSIDSRTYHFNYYNDRSLLPVIMDNFIITVYNF
jgi:hypothetical protein